MRCARPSKSSTERPARSGSHHRVQAEPRQRGGAPPGAIDCVTKNLQALSDEEIEDLFLNSNGQLEQQVFNPCFKGE